MAAKKRASDFSSMGDYLDYLDNLEYAQSVRDAGLMPPPPPPPPKSSFLGDMAPMLGLLAMPFTGGLSASLGTALGSQVAGQVAANALIRGGLGGISAEASGGDFLSGFGKGALTGGITGGISSLAAPFANTIGADVLSSTGSQAFADIASGAIRGGAGALPGALISGDLGNVLSGALTGGVTSGVTSGISDLTGFAPKDVNTAIKVAQAIDKDNPLGALGAIVSNATSGTKFPGTVGNEVTPGLFDAGGEGFYDPATGQYGADSSVSPSVIEQAYQDPSRGLDVLQGERGLTPEELNAIPPATSIQTVDYATRIDPLQELRLQTGLTPNNEGFYLADLGDTPPPVPAPAPTPTPITAPERNAFLEANIPEPETVQQLMQEYFPEIYRAPVADQRVEVTGTREVPIEQTAFEQHMQQYAAPAPVEPPGILEGPSKIDVTGSLYKHPPLPWEGPSLEDEPIYEQPPTPAPSPGPSPSPAPAPAPAPAPSPAPAPAAQSGIDMSALFALLGMMNQPAAKADPYQVARIQARSPFGNILDEEQPSMDELLQLIGRG